MLRLTEGLDFLFVSYFLLSEEPG